MPYKNIEDRRAASRRHYNLNKHKYLDRNRMYRVKIDNYIKNYKSSKPCTDCGVYYPYYVMDFDHIDSSSKLGIVSFFSKTGRIGALKKEIEKCEIVCSNCHRQRTHERLKQNNL